VGWTATNALRADFALHLLRLDMSFHNTRTPGELIERVDGDVTALANLLSALSIRVLSHLLLTAGVLIALYLVDWRVGLGLTAFAAVALLVAELEHGLDTLIGPRGVKLSGGQVQRTAAARVFVRDPELLVFDDLSSALDVETERLL
jgi:ABC-type multidrug transport system fused ATPase/permease subunit